ncbi:MAG: 60S ribosomal protein L26, partial [Candidatus Methanomethylophilaceae archaeon]|nr:60S ribosomal protein L26 [Candidatus Methanomethylophilaceae archaeon]
MVSSKARIQRKTSANAPVHVKRKMLSAHLSKDLSKQYGKR